MRHRAEYIAGWLVLKTLGLLPPRRGSNSGDARPLIVLEPLLACGARPIKSAHGAAATEQIRTRWNLPPASTAAWAVSWLNAPASRE